MIRQVKPASNKGSALQTSTDYYRCRSSHESEIGLGIGDVATEVWRMLSVVLRHSGVLVAWFDVTQSELSFNLYIMQFAKPEKACDSPAVFKQYCIKMLYNAQYIHTNADM